MSFWKTFFGDEPRDLFLRFTPEGSTWRVVSWNSELTKQSERNLALEIHRKEREIILWERGTHSNLKFYHENRMVRMRRLTPKSELIDLMNLSLHATVKYSLEINRPFMLEPVSGATTLDFQNEAKALLWVQATFGMLIRALDRLTEDRALILTASIFSGTAPETNENVLRVLAFNLDIFYYLRPDLTLQIVIFNDRDQGHGGSKTPAFQQIIKVTKPQFYDEIGKLAHRLAQVGEIS